jgi:hypothetical protein
MSSRFLAAALAAGCVTAAAGGAYIAVRQNAAPEPAVTAPAAPDAAPATTAPVAKPVAETEAVIDEPAAKPARADETAQSDHREVTAPARPAPRPARASRPEPARNTQAPRSPAAASVPPPAGGASRPSANAAPERPVPDVPAASPVAAAQPEPVRLPEPRPAPKEPQFEEVVLPASSVLGLQVDTSLSSERTRPEDRVDARVTRDVTAGGRVAIPAGSRVIGSVTTVERGGKMKDRARLGVRFHTLVLADGREVPLRTETIIREGDSPTNESARKIGGAAVGGAILGAILGGGKGAMMGGAAGAAGGSAAVMAGDRNAATLPAGTVVSVRLSGPATIEVERPPQ